MLVVCSAASEVAEVTFGRLEGGLAGVAGALLMPSGSRRQRCAPGRRPRSRAASPRNAAGHAAPSRHIAGTNTP